MTGGANGPIFLSQSAWSGLDVVGDEGRPASSTIALVAVALREGLEREVAQAADNRA